MIDDLFRQQVERRVGCAVILAGSGSDKDYVAKIVQSLRVYEIPYEVRVASAHKQPEPLLNLIKEYDSLNGPLVYIAVAGGTDALSGTLSFHSWRPTISNPPDYPQVNISCLENPPGSSNAYVKRPENVGRFIAQLFSSFNETYREKLKMSIETKIMQLEEDDRKLQEERWEQP